MYNILADMHTHTVLSMHAFSTINENIEQAKAVGLKYLACTDHYFKLGEEGSTLYRNEILGIWGTRRINRTDDRIKILSGVEFNTCQEGGYPDMLVKLPWKLSSCHNWFVEDKSLEDIKESITMLINEKKIDAIGHPDKFISNKFDDKNYIEFYDWLIDICKKNNISIEVNGPSCRYDKVVEYVKYWLSIAKKNDVMIHLGTDAHYFKEIGNFDSILKVINEVKYPEELILNCREDLLEEMYNTKQLDIMGK